MSKQIRALQQGDTVAVMKTTLGEIKILLFPDAAPKTVENFTTHAKNGYYNGIIFHRVMKVRRNGQEACGHQRSD